MAVPSTIVDLSTTAASNSPSGADTVSSSTGPDDYLRAHAAILRTLAASTTLAAGATTDLSSVTGTFVTLTGTATTINALGTLAAGAYKYVIYNAAHTVTHNATSLILLGGASRTVAAGDVSLFVSEGSGNWRELSFSDATGYQAYDTNTAKVNVEQTWTAQQVPMNGTLTDGATIDWNGDSNGQVVSVTLAGNRTLNAPTNINANACYVLRVHQDATGSRTLTWNAAYKFAGGVDPVLTTTASSVDVFSFIGGASNILYCIGIAKGLA